VSSEPGTGQIKKLPEQQRSVAKIIGKGRSQRIQLQRPLTQPALHQAKLDMVFGDETANAVFPFRDRRANSEQITTPFVGMLSNFPSSPEVLESVPRDRA